MVTRLPENLSQMFSCALKPQKLELESDSLPIVLPSYSRSAASMLYALSISIRQAPREGRAKQISLILSAVSSILFVVRFGANSLTFWRAACSQESSRHAFWAMARNIFSARASSRSMVAGSDGSRELLFIGI